MICMWSQRNVSGKINLLEVVIGPKEIKIEEEKVKVVLD